MPADQPHVKRFLLGSLAAAAAVFALSLPLDRYLPGHAPTAA